MGVQSCSPPAPRPQTPAHGAGGGAGDSIHPLSYSEPVPGCQPWGGGPGGLPGVGFRGAVTWGGIIFCLRFVLSPKREGTTSRNVCRLLSGRLLRPFKLSKIIQST